MINKKISLSNNFYLVYNEIIKNKEYFFKFIFKIDSNYKN